MNDQQQTDAFDEWAIVDVMGHQRYAGRVTEQTIAGQGFIRVDMPGDDEHSAMTKLFAPGAIHSISPCTEAVARAAAVRLHLNAAPISRYELPASLPPPDHSCPHDPDGEHHVGCGCDEVDDKPF